MIRKWFFAILVTIILSWGGITPATSQESTLVGDYVQAVLTPGVATLTITPFTTSPVQVVDPGEEFTGELEGTAWSSYNLTYNVHVDIFSDYFTVTVEATNDWLTEEGGNEITGIGVGSDSSIYDIQISDIDLPGGIGPVVFDPSHSIGFIGPSDIREITWNADLKEVNIRFGWARKGVTIAFALQGDIVDVVVDELLETIETIDDLDSDIFPNENMSNALTNKIIAAIELVDQGLYEEALDKLQHDILSKTDGCAKSGSPDKNDWITNCIDQDKVYPLILEAIELLESLL